MKLFRIFSVILLIMVASTSRCPGQGKAGQLIFQSGFEASSHMVDRNGDADIIGTDNSLPDHNDWVRDLDENPNIGAFGIQYQGGDSSMRFARIVKEPGNSSNHVLQFWLGAPNVEGKKGRIQANLYGNTGIYEFYQSVRMFLPIDMNAIKNYPGKIHWLTIAEFWNNITWNQNVPYRFRITLGIGKNHEGPADLNFILDAEDCELFSNGGQKYSTVWAETNEKYTVPVGKWFTADIYFREGDNSSGRFWFAITPDGGERQVIFDMHKITHNTTDPHPDGLGDFNPIKLYTSKDLINYMKSQGKALEIYWDDYRLWKDKTPE